MTQLTQLSQLTELTLTDEGEQRTKSVMIDRVCWGHNFTSLEETSDDGSAEFWAAMPLKMTSSGIGQHGGV